MPRPPSRPEQPASGRNSRILPIAARLDADTTYAGRGVTVAFLDSGFFAHPDLITPRDRILAYHDILAPRTTRRALAQPTDSSWHGMMTSVVACGNGFLSRGKYRGLAHEAEVVLVKVGQGPRVRHDDLRRGFDWVLENKERYGIRVVNASCGGDYEASYLTDRLSKAADAAVAAGITVVAAVGNAGHEATQKVLPPASAPSVLTVGGFDDNGTGSFAGGYHSSFGPTIDGLQKPEIVAPAIWVAAPILPGTPTSAQAKLLAVLDDADDESLESILADHPGVDADFDGMADRDPYLIRQLVAAKSRAQKVLSRHYKHVDGTSFAAPIIASVVAQMLEANGALTPQAVKRILLRTSRRLPEIPPERQGFGLVQPSAAVEAARSAT